jgi:hypothetical protein
MTSLTTTVADIIVELKKLQNKTKPPIDKDDPFQLPRMIGTGDGNGIIVSRKIDRLIETVSRHLILNDPSLARRVRDEEWNTTVRGAFGPALVRIDLDDDLQQNALAVLDSVVTSIKNDASAYGPREFAFACTLFSNNTAISAFAIGPVRFEPRLDWLTRKVAEGAIPTISERRIKRAWNGGKLAKRKASMQSIREKNIMHAVGNAPYVCSISTSGFATVAALENALTAARLSLTSIALLWQTPSKALAGLNLTYDRIPHQQISLSFVPGNVLLWGAKWSHMPHGPYLAPGEWEKRFANFSGYFKVVGEIVDYFLSADGNVARPKMMNVLGQALLWFHEGCRETVTLMAIVKFSASMDALGGGRKADGIRKIINVRLGIKDGQTIRSGGPTMKATIDAIYSHGRSRTLHGTNEKLGNDWSSIRAVAEQFARMCLMACIDWAANNATADEPSLLKK